VVEDVRITAAKLQAVIDMFVILEGYPLMVTVSVRMGLRVLAVGKEVSYYRTSFLSLVI
jgi:hypothetical protein